MWLYTFFIFSVGVAFGFTLAATMAVSGQCSREEEQDQYREPFGG